MMPANTHLLTNLMLSLWVQQTTQTRGSRGTTMAAPHVAGAVALLLETDGNLSPQEVAQELRQRATPYVVKADEGSHNLLLYTGDGQMLSYTTTTTTTTSVVWGDDPWVVSE